MVQTGRSTRHRTRLGVLSLVLTAVTVLFAALGAGASAAPAGAAQQGAALYVGGSFTTAGGVPATRVASYPGGNWEALTGPSGEGTDSLVSELEYFRGKLIVGGGFIEAGGETVSGIASWDGARWAPLTGSSGIPGVTVAPLGFVSSMAVYNGDLYVAGFFPRAGGTTTVNGIARWDGTEWHALNGPGGPGVLLQGRATAIWDLHVHNGQLIVAGEFDSAGGVTSYGTAAWNGTTWSSLGMTPEANDTVMSVASHNGALVATRSYVVDNRTVNQVVRYDGTRWTPLTGPGGTGLNDAPRVLTVFRGELIVGGHFTQAGGVTVNYVARWNGRAWAALTGPAGTGVDSTVYSLAVHNGDLIVGGDFDRAGGVLVNRIARWNGAGWSALPAASGTGLDGGAFALLSAPAL